MSASPAAGEPVELIVTTAEADCRLDWFLARRFPTYSRTHLRKAINAAQVRVDGFRRKASHRLTAGQRVDLVFPDLPREGPAPEPIPLAILYEDDHLAVVDKPPGMVVHPGKGHWSGTLTGALAFHFGQLSTAGGPTRPGIVHRLDRDTSGLIVVAKTDEAHFKLADQFEQRTIDKEYFAITAGQPQRDRDVIELPIGPHPSHREKMAVRREGESARPARTFYEVKERFDGFATVRLLPKTGRTHQLRVHLASLGCPVLCDKLYGGRAEITRGELARRSGHEEVVLARQALHAHRLALTHPVSGEPLEFVAPIPEDLRHVADLLAALRPLTD